MKSIIVESYGKIRLMENTLTDGSKTYDIEVKCEDVLTNKKDWYLLFSSESEDKANQTYDLLQKAQGINDGYIEQPKEGETNPRNAPYAYDRDGWPSLKDDNFA